MVIEMGLGTSMGEWMHIAQELSTKYGVMLYERAGVNHSKASSTGRTPTNIANELYDTLKTVDHEDKMIIIAHSQGGLYAQQFTRLYPDLIRGIILLDPLSANDNIFKELLSKKEYKRSGVDKSNSISIMYTLAKLKLGFFLP